MYAASLWTIEMVALSAGLLAADARAQIPRPNAPPPSDSGRSGWVALGCKNPGIQQDTAKTPLIQNTTAAAIPRGRSLLWRANDGDHGGVTLGEDLAPGDSVKGTGKPARLVYTCDASFHAGQPDLVVVEARLEGVPSAVIQNANAWLDAGPTRVKFELLRCADDTMLAVKNVGPLAVGAGAKQTFTAELIAPGKSAPSYIRVTADFDRRVAESNEKNNTWSNRSECARRGTQKRP